MPLSRQLTPLTNAFPLWVLVFCGAALVVPDWFTWFRGPWIVWGLAITMLGMGVTLTLEDFKAVKKMPKPVAIGFVGQYTIMPLLGWGIGWVLGLPTEYAVGLVLVACCPGGTASNVVTFIAKADVCLSVVMTACSTVAAAIMTPLLTATLVGTRVPVDAWGLFASTFQVVIIPVLLGVVLNRFWPRAVTRVLPIAPLVSVIAIAMICASIIGQRVDEVKSSAGTLLLAVTLLHIGGFGIGYTLSRLFKLPRRSARTVSIEVGMQNSGLGVVLANKHFASPITGVALAAVPCAISAVMHSVIGSVCAGYWRWRDGRVAGKSGC
ncbi:bile acid:sodium symporter family protein [Synoicihabitans lomoniglobus]|uniref:Bile acid:sodium symporter family protein n=1 Tax=Synoicihabitans lomoniglobus TaxID=2909285 RepID=A0AAF0CNW4_9BACT|nr:bile acid:sodium symporter family protein [Opitutaceae bacterium LMO-M01]WED63004.1 bile acid:sodium symporter family protein [Opitutaceae bacterium LMO-M01]